MWLGCPENWRLRPDSESQLADNLQMYASRPDARFNAVQSQPSGHELNVKVYFGFRKMLNLVSRSGKFIAP
ncbi:hypothetical protein C4J81_11650 [Deltaproteobacteria bacterium Smac51]|nr:hypothetical protein C4J81_11650 [Deltaproteobacteria bacterium Smac51]